MMICSLGGFLLSTGGGGGEGVGGGISMYIIMISGCLNSLPIGTTHTTNFNFQYSLVLALLSI